jgi:hypothetical protein
MEKMGPSCDYDNITLSESLGKTIRGKMRPL